MGRVVGALGVGGATRSRDRPGDRTAGHGVVPAAIEVVGNVESAKAPVSVAVMTKLPLFLVTVMSPGRRCSAPQGGEQGGNRGVVATSVVVWPPSTTLNWPAVAVTVIVPDPSLAPVPLK